MLYLLLILFPISMALSSFVLRRRTGLVIFVALGAVLAQLLVATQIPLDDPTRFLGVTLSLSALNRVFLLVFLAIGGFAFVAAWHLPHGENFVPIALLTLAQVSAVLLLQDPFITTLLLASTGLTAVLAIVDLPAGASNLVGTRAIAAALKYLVLMVVAATLMYIAFVLTDIFRPGELPGRISPARFILALLAVSFALRLALIPFHTWLTDLVEHAEPLVTAVILTLLNTTSLLVLILVFQSFPTLLFESEGALGVMRLGAIVSTLVAGALALAPGGLRRTAAYLVLYNCGMVFYGLASASSLGLAGAIFGALNQTIAVMLLFVSIGLLERPDGRTPGVVRRDLLRRWPVAGAGFLASGLALLGLPPTSGALSHQLIYQAAAAHGWVELLPLLAGTALAGLGMARVAAERLLGPGEEALAAEPLLLGETELDRPAVRRLELEPRSAAALTLTLLLICLAIGLYPQPILATIDEAIRGLAFIRAL
ncbi:MAG TPA: proton-conducting transporter membrane subunit [Chloroflexaceae bacterium]|nr:proton-conducting transporter membrane subunit [Chloroflexaceae bacterium]